MYSYMSIRRLCQSINQSKPLTLSSNSIHNTNRGAVVLSCTPGRTQDCHTFVVSIWGKLSNHLNFVKLCWDDSRLKVINWNSSKSKCQIIQIDYCIQTSDRDNNTAKTITKRFFFSFLRVASFRLFIFLAIDRYVSISCFRIVTLIPEPILNILFLTKPKLDEAIHNRISFRVYWMMPRT